MNPSVDSGTPVSSSTLCLHDTEKYQHPTEKNTKNATLSIRNCKMEKVLKQNLGPH